MQCNWNSDLPWLSGGEQDFPLGAKATSCLPSATHLDHDYNSNNKFELPDWMESRENLGISNIDLFDDIKFPVKMEHDIAYQVNGITELEEDYSQTMKPEDMLVPLSELQPETYTPQGIGANTLSAVPSIPKISIRVSKVAIPEQENHTMCSTGIQPSFQINVMQPQNSTYLQIQQLQNSNYHQIQSSKAIPPIGDAPNYNADELLNELVDMATKEPNGLTNLITSFDSSLVQAGMDDLLSQLESCDASQEMADVSPWASAPASPVSVPSPVFVSSPISVPSPVPSVGSLSPQSTGDRSFHQQTPNYTIDDTAIQPEYGKEASVLSLLSPKPEYGKGTSVLSLLSPKPEYGKGTSFLSLLSPSTDDNLSVLSPSTDDSLSVPSPSLIDDDDESEGEYSRSEMHSYSRSPRKSKSSRKTSSLRGTAHPEGRRERKKEQNKQAALRYRQKKKQEDDVLLSQIEVQEERQEKLKAKYSNLKQELTYLKKIMREVLIAKGTVSPDAFKKK